MAPSSRWLFEQVHGRKPPRSERRHSTGKGPARNWRYLAWIRTLPCAVCGLEGKGLVEAAHTGTDGGMRLKASDYSCIPLCFDHHQGNPDAYHAGVRTFERIHRIDCRRLVDRLNHDWFVYSRRVK